VSLYLAGQAFGLGLYYNTSLVVAATLFGYHLYLIRDRQPKACFKAFLHNNWVGMVIFAGVALDYMAGGA
ncbi:MAG: 4-hydroxybenzoate octaprenyltransferase, partial [Gammaproteobacteria bacterium]